MNIKQLKDYINSIPEEYDDLNVWIDADHGERGKPVKLTDINVVNSTDCCLDGDYGSEELHQEDLENMFMFETFPEPESFEFLNMIRILNQDNYEYVGNDKYLGHTFSRKILAIKF